MSTQIHAEQNKKKKAIVFLAVIAVVLIIIVAALIAFSTVKRAQVRDMLVGRAFIGEFSYGENTSLESEITYKIKFTSNTHCYVYRCELLNGKCYDEQHDYYEIPYAVKGGLSVVKLDVRGEYGKEDYSPLSGEKLFEVLIDGDNVELYIPGYVKGFPLVLEQYDDSPEPEKTPIKLN